jgi:2-polyprenyl-6-hydroxyphenyl methylase/3-demethylubiquinone-9 3-methyltransferase
MKEKYSRSAEAAKSVDPQEIERFSRQADQWWDERGSFAPLHRINPLRVSYIQDQAARHFKKLPDISVLDIGCGGGLACEPLSRLGARVTGIDASAENIEAAKAHAEKSGLNIDYRCTTAEELVISGQSSESGKNTTLTTEFWPLATSFDMVLALEVIEHVADVSSFVETCCRLVRPGGLIIFSTLNRTAKSFGLAIVGAEYVLRWVPRGTHDWNKFLKPSEIAHELRKHDMQVREMTGMVYHPLENKWQLDGRDLSVNYLLTAARS